MPYTPTTISGYTKRTAIVDDVFDNVLTPLKDTHSIFTAVAKGLPHAQSGGLRKIVVYEDLPKAFVDEVPLQDVPTGFASSIGDGSHVATVGQRITDLVVAVSVIAELKSTDVVNEIAELYGEPILDLMYGDTRRGAGNALTTELIEEGHTGRTQGDRIALAWIFGTPFSFTVAP